MYVYVVLYGFTTCWIAHLHTAIADVTNIYSTDACRNSGKYLKCSHGNVLRIHDVKCIPGSYTCPEVDKIVSLCEGQRSCDSIGLRQQLRTCQSQAKQTIRVTYGCEKASISPPCRTNICSQESRGLICNTGDVIHIIGAKCEHGKTNCSWKIYHNLFTICEGRQTCYASGLRLLSLRSVCEKTLRASANVFVDYICIEESLADQTCTGEIRVLSPRFGIIKSPGFPNNPDGNPNSCYWTVYEGLGQMVEVTVHAAYSQELTMKCTEQFLQVKYTDCATSERKTEMFCHVSMVNINIKSCGSVIVQSVAYKAGEDRGNRFLLSYQVKGMTTDIPAYTPYSRPCDVTPPYSQLIDNTQVSNSTPVISQPDEEVFNPDRFSLILKIVVINFFMFILAFILIVAIILVCYKYRQNKKHGKYNLTTQSETDSSRRATSDTQMQTFSESTQEKITHRNSFTHPAQHKHNTYASLSSDDPYASVHRSQCHSVASYNDVNTNNRISTFRPKEGKNPYASYDSLDYDIPADLQNDTSHEIHTSADIYNQPDNDELPPPPSEIQTQQHPAYNYNDQKMPSKESDVPHYTINDDDYAIVQKPRKNTMDRDKSNTNKSHAPNSNSPSANDSLTPKMQIIVNDKSAPSPSKHYSPTFLDSPQRQQPQFSSNVGYLPHHDCMLADHRCNIPPVPPSPARQNGHSNIHAYSDRF